MDEMFIFSHTALVAQQSAVSHSTPSMQSAISIGPSNIVIISPTVISLGGLHKTYPPCAPLILRIILARLSGLNNCSK